MRYHPGCYQKSYYTRNNENLSHFYKTLKYQDAFPALCYALGMASTYDEALEYVGMTRRDSLNFTGNGSVGPYDSDQMYPLWDTTAIKNVGIEHHFQSAQ